MKFSSRFECVKTRGSRIGGLKDRMFHGTREDGGVHIPTHGVVSSTAVSGTAMAPHGSYESRCRKSNDLTWLPRQRWRWRTARHATSREVVCNSAKGGGT